MSARSVQIAIDLSAIQYNLNVARKQSPNQKLFAVVKSDAYGHGAVRVAQALSDADAFAVVTMGEALELRTAAIEQPILVLQGPQSASDIATIHKHALWPALHHQEQIEWLNSYKAADQIQAWLKVDSGMGRLGFQTNEAVAVLTAKHHFNWFGVLTHFASADEPDNPATTEQIKLFYDIVKHASLQTSLANSAGLLAWPDAMSQWARPGIMLYGSNPVNNSDGSLLKPAMRVTAPVVSVKHYESGTAIGYAGTYRVPEAMPVAYVGIGYGDGLPRVIDETATVLINGSKCPIIGRVSMDSIAVDVRSVANVAIGAEAVIWGPEHPAEHIANAAGTISYEIFTSIRGQRTYVT